MASISESSSVSPFSELPVAAMREKIVEKIRQNRVTLIIGETGCGKSSQIPQFLLEENMGPVLCTQPRRFAVVAVARMVAAARNCEVGGEVGYHIGHSRVLSSGSKIFFKTAGVLLDEMREKGFNALNYKVIVLDEVHERSVESDLVLACIKQFLLRKKDLRVVLMSATADISRYSEYFNDLGRDEKVEVVAIPNSVKNTIYTREVVYLDQVTKLLGMDSENLSLKYCSGPSPSMAKAKFTTELHKLVHELILHIHKNEPDIEKSILVFLPTYNALEEQWFHLKPFGDFFRVHILHRSIDTNQALRAMKICKSHRKVILATNIAESSVTIPKVGYVIDSCRSLQVFWDNSKKTDSAELVWVSKSQAEQRRGRTGRTCDGQVYRLVTGSFYSQLEKYESPAILKLSLRLQVLLICCAASKAINDPKALLQKAMDPPDPDVVEDALEVLVEMRALEKGSSRSRHGPTFYGRLLASFSLSFDASVLILKFGEIGMIREGILFGILMDLQPLPILRLFGQNNQSLEYTDCYYDGSNEITGLRRKEVLYVANFCAFQFWQRAFKDKWRLARLQNFNLDEKEDAKIYQEIEEEWCLFHKLVMPALEQITETYDDILNTLHRFRPKCLILSNGVPVHYEPYEFQHTCNLKCLLNHEADGLALADGVDDEDEYKECVALPFVGPYDFLKHEIVTKFALIVKEMTINRAGGAPSKLSQLTYDTRHEAVVGPALCRYFVSGLCNRGSQCPFSHSLQAKKPACKFFFSLQGCRNGDSCFFSHDSDSYSDSPPTVAKQLSLSCPEDPYIEPGFLLQFLHHHSYGKLLLLDDSNLHFSSNLARHRTPSSIIATTSQTDAFSLDPSLKGINVFYGLAHPSETILSSGNVVPWSDVACVLWFPRFGDDDELHMRGVTRDFFTCLAIRMLGTGLYDRQLVVTMNNIRFSRLQVEKLARDSFFVLKASVPFDESSFGKLFDDLTTKKSMLESKPVSYVFHMYPPTDLQFGDYTALLRQHLL